MPLWSGPVGRRHCPLLKVDTGKSRQLDECSRNYRSDQNGLQAQKTSWRESEALLHAFGQWNWFFFFFTLSLSSLPWAHDWRGSDLLWKQRYLMTYHCCIYSSACVTITGLLDCSHFLAKSEPSRAPLWSISNRGLKLGSGSIERTDCHAKVTESIFRTYCSNWYVIFSSSRH